MNWGALLSGPVEFFRAIGRRLSHAGGGWSVVLGRSRLDYQGSVGQGYGSSAVVACLNAIAHAALEAPLLVEQRTPDGWEVLPDHPMLRLLHRPNPAMSWPLILQATLNSLHTAGDGYLYKTRSAAGRVVELWPLFPHLVEPAYPADGSEYLTAYIYRPGNQRELYLDPRDVVHIRLGLDPENPRRGMPPMRSLLREIFTDLEAAEFSATILANLGIPGVIISPDEDVPISGEAAEQIKDKFQDRFSKDGRGAPLVLSGRTKVSVLSFSPEQLRLGDLRRLPEERITAVLGVPAIVAGLGAGLSRSTFNNVAEAREAFYETKIIPLQRLLEAELERQLLPEFDRRPGVRLRHDISVIRVLQEDEDNRQARLRAAVTTGILSVNEARAALGLERLDNGDVFLRPINLIEVPLADLGRPALPPGSSAKILGPIEHKAPDDLARALQRLRQTFEPSFVRQIDRSFADQAGRLAARYDVLAARKDAGDVDLDALFAGEDDVLRGEWGPIYRTLLEQTWPLLNDYLGIAIAFDLSDPAVAATLRDAGERIVGINDTTREAVRMALREGQEAGEGIPQLARRVRTVVTESYRGRAETIARTELGEAQNQAATERYIASGVVRGVRVLDGLNDDICAAVAGTTQTLEWARVNNLGHPRCVRAMSPILEGQL